MGVAHWPLKHKQFLISGIRTLPKQHSNTMLLKLILVLAVFSASVLGRSKEFEEARRKKQRKPGKTISLEGNGNIDITIRRKKYSNQKERFLCCPLSTKHCTAPCKGTSCTATCTVSCGFFAFFKCAPLTCAAANPTACTATAGTCEVGWTLSGTKCFKVEDGPSNWLASQTTCIGLGGTLAKIESAADQTAVAGVAGTDQVWIGLQDFLIEGTFSWADGTALGAYTNWLAGQPDNAGVGQHCAAIRPADGAWNDIICNREQKFVCEK